MQIKIRLFASLRESYGFAERILEINDGLTLGDVWQVVSEGASADDEVLMAVNMDYAQPDLKIKEGDEVAFFPPVTGG